MWRSTGSAAPTATVLAAAVAGAAAATLAANSSSIARRLFATSSSRVATLTRRRPANVGDCLTSVETPCLVVDLDAMEHNMAALDQSLAAIAPHVTIRPHAKAHKCAAIGELQLQSARTVGLCCQKVAEAEAMFAGGARDLLLSNELIGTTRYARMAVLVRRGAVVTLLFDNHTAVQQASDAARNARIVFRALVDVNVGQHRCGVDTVDEAVALAHVIDQAPGLQLVGIQAYHGAAQHIRNYDDKARVIDSVIAKATAVRNAFRATNLDCRVVTGGGTGTYKLEAASGVFTEVQPGSYLFNDVDYARNLAADGQSVRDWRQSLFVVTTVMSVNQSSTNAAMRRAVVDAGTKAMSLDSGPPRVAGSFDAAHWPPLARLEYQSGGDEHGILVAAATDADTSDDHVLTTIHGARLPVLGEMLLLTPGHCDPTTNLYDFIVAYRNGRVEHVWEINGRGPGN